VGSSLRSFREQDRPAVLELSRHALQRPQEQVGNPLWTTAEELESELSDWEVPPEETLLVDEVDGEIVGFAGVEVSPGFDHADLFGPLVAPGHRGQKLGTVLLEASIERAEDKGARSIVGAVGARNASGRILLERAGFSLRGSATAVFRLSETDHRLLRTGPKGLTVRRGTEADLEPVMRLYLECFPEGAFPASAWQAGLEQGAVYLAESEGAAWAVVNIDPADRWIYHLGVTESERSQGIGAFVLSEALASYWSSHPGETLGLSVTADNLPALRLYRRQGFAPLLVVQAFELPL
jgi:[ribosomal protein S18]-alanine N-acetyltransferase